MEEDIKILEELKRPILGCGFEKQTAILKAIENLIDRNKELEEMLKHRIKYTNELEKDLFENASNYVIPKSKVKEKIEEIDKEIKDLTIRLCVRGSGKTIRTLQQTIKMEKRNMLQELLEKE